MKKTITRILMLASICMGTISNGQTPNWDWAKSAVSTGNENGYSTVTDALGNVYVTGNYNSPSITFGAYILSNLGSSDIFLVKYDALGNVLWAKRAGDSGNDFSNSIAIDSSGYLYVSGGYDSPSLILGADTLTNVGGNDIIVIKYDASGNVIGAKGEGGTGTEFSQSIATDDSGNVYITGGYTSGTLTIGGTTLTNTSGFGGSKVFIVKYDSSSNVLWVKGAGGNVFDNKGQGITTDVSGNVYVIGFFDYPSITFGTVTIQNSGGTGQLYDMFLVKYDASGNVLWAKGAGAASSDQRGVSATTDATGNVFVTGYYKSSMKFGTITLTNAGGIDLCVAKYDSLGNVLWAKGAGGVFDDYASSATTDASGNLYVTGSYKSPVITFGSTTVNNGGGWGSTFDMFLVKYDASGNVLWLMSQGGASNDYGNGINSDAGGNVYTTGTYNSASIAFGASTLTNTGGADMFIAKLGTTITGIADNIFNTEINVYPNPAKNQLAIGNWQGTIKNVKIYDLTGREVYNENHKTSNANAEITIDVSKIPSGIYVVQIQTADYIGTKKLVIEK